VDSTLFGTSLGSESKLWHFTFYVFLCFTSFTRLTVLTVNNAEVMAMLPLESVHHLDTVVISTAAAEST